MTRLLMRSRIWLLIVVMTLLLVSCPGGNGGGY
jgi:hypothetical protein